MKISWAYYFWALIVVASITAVQSKKKVKAKKSPQLRSNRQEQVLSSVEKAQQMTQLALDEQKKTLDELQINRQDMIEYAEKTVKDMQLIKQVNVQTIQVVSNVNDAIGAWKQFFDVKEIFKNVGLAYEGELKQILINVLNKVQGLQDTIKTVISLDAIVICILSLVLIKILKEEFLDQGYQAIDSQGNRNENNSAPQTQNDINTGNGDSRESEQPSGVTEIGERAGE